MYNLIACICTNLYCLIVSMCFYVKNNKKLRNAKDELETKQLNNFKTLVKGIIIIFSIGIAIELATVIVLALR